jgi:squalene-hopene/tetraprenyl-beta-curcumene cyclase
MEEQVDALFKSTNSTKEKVSLSRLERAIDRVRRYVLGMQDPVEGFWVDQLEADVTIPSEYLMFRRYIGRVDLEKEARLVKYIRSIQMEDGGRYLYRGGPSDLSATIKAYFALNWPGYRGTSHYGEAPQHP